MKTNFLHQYQLLVIDDIPFCRLLPGMMLRPFGAQVYEASHVQEALQALSSQRFDLVLLDYSMPGTNGAQALQLLRSSEHIGHAKICAYTAYEEEMVGDLMGDIGFDGVLKKPFKTQDLINLISPPISK